MACVIGDREEELGATDFSGDARSLQKALEEISAAGNGDGEMLAFELFWVPGDDDEVLMMDDITLEWPELISC